MPNEKRKPCNNPMCERRTALGVDYCCAPCAYAHENHYEIHPDGPLGHTASCNDRHTTNSKEKADE